MKNIFIYLIFSLTTIMYADVGSIAGHETICSRCVINIDGEGEKRNYA